MARAVLFVIAFVAFTMAHITENTQFSTNPTATEFASSWSMADEFPRDRPLTRAEIANAQKGVLDVTNEQREEVAGISPLYANSLLEDAAQKHTQWMATSGTFSHTGEGGSSVADRITAEGYVWQKVGENIAACQTSVDAVVTAWMNSPGHRANILDAGFRELGVGYYYCATCTYQGFTCQHWWTQDFGTRQGCGNGIVQGSEQCDDQNNINGDGCAANCTIEAGATCKGTAPSVCTGVKKNGSDDDKGDANEATAIAAYVKSVLLMVVGGVMAVFVLL